MRLYKIIEDGYIVGIGQGLGGEAITQTKYDEILELIATKPQAEEGHEYKLRTDLTWELCEVVPIEAEATIEDYQASLEELGVDMNE